MGSGRIPRSVDPRAGGTSRGPDPSTGLLEALVDFSAECLCVLEPRQDFHVILANEATCRLLGRPLVQLLAMAPRDWGLDGFANEVDQYWGSGTTSPRVCEIMYRQSDGRVLPLEIRLQRVQRDDQAYVLCSLRDITARTQAETAALHSRSLLAATLESTADGILVVDTGGRISSYNQRFASMWGLPVPMPTDDDGRMMQDILRQLEDPAAFVARSEELHQQPWSDGCDVIVLGDGRVFEWYSRPHVLDGTAIGRVWSFRDVTDRVRIEQALSESEDRYRDLVEHSADLICTHDLEGRLLSVNAAAERLLGYPADKLIGTNIRDGLVPEARSRFDAYLETIRQHGVATGVMHIQTATGETRFWEYHNTLRTEGVATPVVRGVAHDVTKRKIAEHALRESERRLRLAVEASGQGLIDVNVQTGVATVSPELAAMLEREREGLQLPLEDLREQVHPDDRESALRALQEHLEGRSPNFHAEFRIRTRSGRWKWLLAHGGIVHHDTEGRPRRLLVVHLDISDLKEAEFERAREAGRRRVLFEQATDGIAVLGPAGEIIEANASLARMLGYSMSELRALRLSQWDETFHDVAGSGPQFPDAPTIIESRLRRKDGSTLEVEVSYTPSEWSGQKLLFHVCRDITRRKRADSEQAILQAQLLQAQKMESVGRLAGGIAHDFNNLLSVILGYCDLALDEVGEGPLRADLEEIHRAARRSADLTQRLLAFSRRQTAAPRVLDLNEAVAGVLKMLRRLMGEDIELAWLPGSNLGAVAIDPAQVDSLLANLCVNARDAIAGVGRVTIETRNVSFDAAYCAEHRGFVPGDYVMLAVSDTGCGMTDEVLAHLFEPFFTTKALGQGTGLGLATVYGTVKQNNGFIDVDSKPGTGTTFEVFLPRVSEAIEPTPDASPRPRMSRGETVLVVEDEHAILKLSETILQGLGYRVVTARTPGEALRLAATQEGGIDLLITDVVMPEMNGRELAERLTSATPGLRCLFVSGYTADVIAHRGILHKGVHFLQKPFSRADFAAKVRDVLSDAPAD